MSRTVLLSGLVVRGREVVEWARRQGLEVEVLTPRREGCACRATLACVLASDVTTDWVRRVALETMVIVLVDAPCDRFDLVAAGATDIISAGAPTEELLSLLEARLRSRRVRIGPLFLDPTTGELEGRHAKARLQHAQSRLLHCLWRAGAPLDNLTILRELDSGAHDGGAIRTHVYNLRRQLNAVDPDRLVRIRAVPPNGYVLEVDEGGSS